MKAVTFRPDLFARVVILFVAAFVALGAANGAAQTKGNILVYSTADGPWPGQYPKDAFNDGLPVVLEAHGYTVTVTDRIDDPEITSSLLVGYDQLWIMSADSDSAGHFSQNEINTILDFRLQGHGLLIMADNAFPQHAAFTSDANQIANPLGVNFYGWADHGDEELITPQFSTHSLFHLVQTIMGHSSEALMSVIAPVNVVATYQGDTLIAVLDDGNGRVVFDVSFTRVWWGSPYKGDTPQYVRNIADWLQHIHTPVPAVSEWGLIILTLLLLAAGVALIILRRQPTTTR